MQKYIDIKRIKENPELFFSKLDKEAEIEFINLLEYFIYKHNIKIDDKEEKEIGKYEISDILPRIVNEFEPLSRDEIYAK